MELVVVEEAQTTQVIRTRKCTLVVEGGEKLNLRRNGGNVLKLLPEWKFIKVVLPRRLLLLLIYLLEH